MATTKRKLTATTIANNKADAEIRRIIGDNMRRYRQTSSYKTQARMAEALDLETNTYGKYENAEAKTPIIILKRFSNLFGIPIDDLFCDKSVPTSYDGINVKQIRLAANILTELSDYVIRQNSGRHSFSR